MVQVLSEHLALRDIQPNRRRVIILEISKRSTPAIRIRNLKRNRLPSRTRKRGNRIAMARRHRRGSEILLLARLVVERRALGGGLAQAGKVEGPRAGKVKGRGREILLLWEEEHEAACLALVAAGDVKVEDGGDAARDFAEEGCSRGVVRLGLIHGDDEVGELVGAVEVGRAGLLMRRWR